MAKKRGKLVFNVEANPDDSLWVKLNINFQYGQLIGAYNAKPAIDHLGDLAELLSPDEKARAIDYLKRASELLITQIETKLRESLYELTHEALAQAVVQFTEGPSAKGIETIIRVSEPLKKRRMNAPRRGTAAKVTAKSVREALTSLAFDNREVTPGAVALLIGCSDSAVYKWLEKHKTTLEKVRLRQELEGIALESNLEH